MKHKIHITINPYSDTELTSSSWDIMKEEPERISVRFKGKEYQIVLDENAPFFEVWSVDEEDELIDCQVCMRPPIPTQ